MVESESALKKQAALRRRLAELTHVLIAFSGGVDSAYLLAEAAHVLGKSAKAALINSPALPRADFQQARQLAQQFGTQLFILNTSELSIPEIRKNTSQRCYFCKLHLFEELEKLAQSITEPVVIIEGSNWDDRDDYRPGLQALAEKNIISPLMEVRLTKSEIRFLSREMGLPTYNKPAAACLYSRIPYGETITAQRVQRVEAAETAIRNLGFRQVRVRDHAGKLARIEIPADDIPRLLAAEIREKILTALKHAGYLYVTLDIQGYRTGSMNEALKDRQ